MSDEPRIVKLRLDLPIHEALIDALAQVDEAEEECGQMKSQAKSSD